jgi:hypothetical protein
MVAYPLGYTVRVDSENSPSDGGVFVFMRLRWNKGDFTMSANTIISFGSFTILGILWLGFGAALILNQALLDTVWQFFRGLPVFVEVLIGLLLLPLIIGLWVWQMPWSLWLRLILIIGLGCATLYTFFPRQL